MKRTAHSQKGFTLIELLVVIGILGILLSIVLIAINPARQFGQANDTKRQSAATNILNAVSAYHADHAGQYPPALNAGSTSAMMISNDTTAYAAGEYMDLCDTQGGTIDPVSPLYIPALPVDSAVVNVHAYMDGIDQVDCNNPGTYTTGYLIWVDTSGRVSVQAPYADETLPIIVTR